MYKTTTWNQCWRLFSFSSKLLTALNSDLALLTFPSLLADIKRPNWKSEQGLRDKDIQLFDPLTPLFSYFNEQSVYIHKKYTPSPPLPILYMLGGMGVYCLHNPSSNIMCTRLNKKWFLMINVIIVLNFKVFIVLVHLFIIYNYFMIT